MRKHFIVFGILLFSQIVTATVFRPMSIREQLREASGFVYGEVLVSESLRDKNGQIITKVTLKANKWLGKLRPSSDKLEVYFPGGKMGSRVQKVHGAPKLVPGEKVVLLTQFNQGKNWVLNLGLGKFSVKRIGAHEIIINQIFPGKPDIGQIALADFFKMAEHIKQKKISVRFKNKYEIISDKEFYAHTNNKEDKSTGRKIASIEEENTRSSNKLETYWLVLILGFLGLFVAFMRKRTR
jgi:hypothetical protein